MQGRVSYFVVQQTQQLLQYYRLLYANCILFHANETAIASLNVLAAVEYCLFPARLFLLIVVFGCHSQFGKPKSIKDMLMQENRVRSIPSGGRC